MPLVFTVLLCAWFITSNSRATEDRKEAGPTSRSFARFKSPEVQAQSIFNPMKLSSADREAIESQLNKSEKASERVWTASRSLDGEQFTLNVDITPTGYTITLTGEGESIYTKTIRCKSTAARINEVSREFLQDVDDVLEELMRRGASNSESL
jgi:hypothetical protein